MALSSHHFSYRRCEYFLGNRFLNKIGTILLDSFWEDRFSWIAQLGKSLQIRVECQQMPGQVRSYPFIPGITTSVSTIVTDVTFQVIPSSIIWNWCMTLPAGNSTIEAG